MKKIVCFAVGLCLLFLGVGCDDAPPQRVTVEEPRMTQADWDRLAKEEELAEKLWTVYMQERDPVRKREQRALLEQHRDKGFVIHGQPLRVLLDKY